VGAPGGGALPPAVGLTARGRLLAGAQPLAEGATSLAVRPAGAGGAYLLFTTRDGQLHARRFAALAAPAAPEPLAAGDARYPRRGCAALFLTPGPGFTHARMRTIDRLCALASIHDRQGPCGHLNACRLSFVGGRRRRPAACAASVPARRAARSTRNAALHRQSRLF